MNLVFKQKKAQVCKNPDSILLYLLITVPVVILIFFVTIYWWMLACTVYQIYFCKKCFRLIAVGCANVSLFFYHDKCSKCFIRWGNVHFPFYYFLFKQLYIHYNCDCIDSVQLLPNVMFKKILLIVYTFSTMLYYNRKCLTSVNRHPFHYVKSFCTKISAK